MNLSTIIRMRSDLVDWWKSGFQVFATVTLRKAFRNDDGSWTNLTREHAEIAAKAFRNNLTRILTGRRGRLKFLAVYEIGPQDGRPHLHFLFDNPNNIDIEDVKRLVKRAASKLDWAYEQTDATKITDEKGAISYCIKSGIEAMIPAACSR